VYDAHSIQSITDRVASSLPRTVTLVKREPIVELGYMTSLDMSRPTRYQTVQFNETRNSKLIGILFCHPKSSLGGSEIVDHLSHFHLRSGDAVDFFCVGYGAYWPPEHFADQKGVTRIDGVDWLFSEMAFSNVIDEFERETAWKYSGETELILLTARRDDDGQASLDYDSAIVCNLEAMSQAKAFTSVRSFFADVFRFAKSNTDSDPTWGLSDNKGLKLGASAVKDAVLSVLPKPLSDAYSRGEHFAVRSIASHR
jgi:hypothetical protein